ncbi:hypothetical protein [Flavobacterium sp. LB2P74]|uniref:hypothetical protein n=1 Tax=Flavobacterium sp. LB2P74 TaxID=3401717 RepID=UPI003AAAFDFC
MADKNTLKNWFRTNLKPTQAQFWSLFDSYFHKDEKIPITAIDDIENILAEKADAEVLAHHLTNATAHADLFGAKEDKSKRGAALGYAPLNEFTKLAIDYLNVVNDLVTGGVGSLLTAEQGKLLQIQITEINTLLNSNDVNLDNVQELVDAIKIVQTSLSTILVNDLNTGGTTKALTAEMGKTLKVLIDAKETISNKATIILEGTNESSNTLYPTVKAVYDWCVARFQKLLLNIETTAAIVYTLDYTNSAKRTVFTSVNPVALTVPTNSVTPIPVGARRELTAQGDGVVTIGGAGITFTTNLSLSMVKGETRILTKIATDTWTVEGNLPVSGALVYKTYFINNLTGNNATGVYQDSNHPFASVDYVVGLGTFKSGDIFFFQNEGSSYPINGMLPYGSVLFRGVPSVILDFSGNSNLSIVPENNNFVSEIDFDLLDGRLVNERNGGAGCYLHESNGRLAVYVKVREVYWNTNNLFYMAQRHRFNVLKAYSSATLIGAGFLWSADRFTPIHVGEFVCLANGASLVTAYGGKGSFIHIDTISGPGSYSFKGGNYKIGNISTTNRSTVDASNSDLTLDFQNSIISTPNGIELGNYYGAKLILTGVVKSATEMSMYGNENGFNPLKVINFSGDIGAGFFRCYGGDVTVENSSIKSLNSPLKFFGGNGNGVITLKNSSFEMVNPQALVTDSGGATRTLKISGISTNATALSDQIGNGIILTQHTNY